MRKKRRRPPQNLRRRQVEKNRKKTWKCVHCDKTYVVESQICPKCHHVMTLETNENKNKHMMFDSIRR